jgi:hypothetical protein
MTKTLLPQSSALLLTLALVPILAPGEATPEQVVNAKPAARMIVYKPIIKPQEVAGN